MEAGAAVVAGASGGGWWRGMKKVGEEDEVGRREGDFFLFENDEM